jgi:uncharacterized DUF497 family protein
VEFEWDENKRLEVARKHGVDLVDAALIFEAYVVTTVDGRRDYGETRYLSMGLANGVLLVVVHTERGGVTRLISAWKAGRNEQREYQASIIGRDPANEG